MKVGVGNEAGNVVGVLDIRWAGRGATCTLLGRLLKSAVVLQINASAGCCLQPIKRLSLPVSIKIIYASASICVALGIRRRDDRTCKC